jgi:deoxyadenosine/deoxycytidine kinase
MLKYNHIAIEGNIGAGKTTLSNFLADKFNGDLLLEEFEENEFLKDFYDDNSYALHAEVQFVLDRSKQLFQFHSQPHNLVFSDYYPLKSLIFSKMNLSPKEFDLINELIDSLYNKVPKPDVLLFLNRPLDELQKNIISRGRLYEKEISPDYLFTLSKAYENFLQRIDDIPILYINANEINLEEPNWLEQSFRELLSCHHSKGIKRINLMK